MIKLKLARLKYFFRYLRKIFFGAKFRLVNLQDINGRNVYQVQTKVYSSGFKSKNMFEWKPIYYKGSYNILTLEEAKIVFYKAVEMGGIQKTKVIKKL